MQPTTTQSRPWADYVSEEDERICRAAGYGGRQGLGTNPAVLVVDATVGMVGDTERPVLESIRQWPDSCGLSAWQATRNIASLVDLAHDAQWPVIFTTPMEPREQGVGPAVGFGKNVRWAELGRRGAANEVHPLIRSQPSDVIVSKPKASAFIATFLPALLVQLHVDTLIVCGGSTSGCVRASAVDAASYNYRVAVVAECTFDRAAVSHAVSLFDLDMKYADVVGLDEIRALADATVARR